MLKATVVGCGKIADGHVEQIRAVGRADLLAICDREPLMAEQLGLRFGIERRYSDLAEMLRIERPDVLHVATPPDTHLAIARLAIPSGCHLFMEKPFALNSPEASEIVELAGRYERQVCVNYLYNFEAPALELDSLLSKGDLGEVVHIDVSYGYSLSGDYGMAVLKDPNHWVHRLPGKLFHNVLDHVIAKFVRHIGDDFSIHALSYRRRPGTDVPLVDAMGDELRFLLKGDSVGSVTVSGMISAHARPVSHFMRILGTRNSAEIDYAARTLVAAAAQSQPSAVGRLFPPWVQAGRFARNGLGNLRSFARHRFHYFECMRALLERFYDSIEAGGAPPILPEEIVRVCKVIDAIVTEIGRAR